MVWTGKAGKYSTASCSGGRAAIVVAVAFDVRAATVAVAFDVRAATVAVVLDVAVAVAFEVAVKSR
jgi:hypothetical protein